MANITQTGITNRKPRKTHKLLRQKSNLKPTVAVVGLGYVGLPLALLAESKGYQVIGLDIDQSRINSLKNGTAPGVSSAESGQLKQTKIKFDHRPRAIKNADVIVICVPTPVHKDHTPDLKPLKSAARSVGSQLKKGALVIVESTVNPGVCEEIVIPILERVSGLKAEDEFHFAHCPERINPGDRQFTLKMIPRVIGAQTRKSSERAEKFYQNVLDTDTLTLTSLKEAESVKMVENAFRDINIAFVNELAMSFDRLGIDLLRVIDAASTKPFGFMAHLPGCGVGGHCIPVDPYYLIDYAQKNGFSHKFIKAARTINNNMPIYAVRCLRQALASIGRTLPGERIALLGLAYKRDVPDCRESPAFVIAEKLKEAGAYVITYDPFVADQNHYQTLEDTLAAADSVVIATDHSVFRRLTPQIFEQYKISVLLDGRNCLNKDDFTASTVLYKGIGR